ncbi:MAG: septal ring lytic transglycosylase RlpA family protein [Terracidiphilus sp.]
MSRGELQGRDMRPVAGWRGAAARGTVSFALLAIFSLGANGCKHRENTRVAPPQALPPEAEPASGGPSGSGTALARIPVTPAPPGGIDGDDLAFVATHRPILSEVGYATWYTAPYKGRHAANGQVFDDDAMTAAHRTLPMGSLVVVTNLKTGESSAMRITDRGPFVEDRMLDLTIASAKAVGIYRTGMAMVRMDVYETPKPISTGGRWCVQIGAFHDEDDAIALKAQLLRDYPGANVIEFPGEKSFWVRIRPEGDDRAMAEQIARQLQPVEGDAYLTRLD